MLQESNQSILHRFNSYKSSLHSQISIIICKDPTESDRMNDTVLKATFKRQPPKFKRCKDYLKFDNVPLEKVYFRHKAR